jgi:hypothetical protein
VAKLPQVRGNRLVKALHTSPVKPGTLSNILKKAEISKEELEDLL